MIQKFQLHYFLCNYSGTEMEKNMCAYDWKKPIQKRVVYSDRFKCCAGDKDVIHFKCEALFMLCYCVIVPIVQFSYSFPIWFFFSISISILRIHYTIFSHLKKRDILPVFQVFCLCWNLCAYIFSLWICSVLH